VEITQTTNAASKSAVQMHGQGKTVPRGELQRFLKLLANDHILVFSPITECWEFVF
jgi:hypothetical protein